MKKIINNDNVVLILLVLATLLVGIANFLIIYFANFLIIYLPPGIGFALAILMMLLSVDVSLVIELKSKWKKVVQLIMLILMFGTSISSMASIAHALEKEDTHNEMVKKEREKERENKHLKQVIDREISKQLDQRKAEINNRK